MEAFFYGFFELSDLLELHLVLVLLSLLVVFNVAEALVDTLFEISEFL